MPESGEIMSQIMGRETHEPGVQGRGNLPLRALGLVFVFLAIVGTILPIMPTVPFILAAAACFVKGSPKLYRRMLANPWFGKYLKRYRQKQRLPLRVRLLSVGGILLSIGVSALWIVPHGMLWLKLLMLLIGMISALYVLWQPGTHSQEKDANSERHNA